LTTGSQYTGGGSGSNILLIPAPGLDVELSELLDELDRIAHPTVIDETNEFLFDVSRALGLPPRSSKLDHENLYSPKGHKSSIQARSTFAPRLQDFIDALRPDGPSGYDTLEIIADLLRRLDSLGNRIKSHIGPHLLVPSEEFDATVRAIRYYSDGIHQPQGWHTDPALKIGILLPPGDEHLTAELPCGTQVTVRGFPEVATIAIINGDELARLQPGAVPTKHAVRRLQTATRHRDVATVFLFFPLD
jgi:hypothetical protein